MVIEGATRAPVAGRPIVSASLPIPTTAPAGFGTNGGACVVGVEVLVDEDGDFFARETVFGGTSDAFGSGGQFSTVEDAAAMAYAVFQAYLQGVVGGSESQAPSDLVAALTRRF